MQKSETCSELEQIMIAWPELPEHIRQAIRALVETSTNKHDNHNKDL